MMINLLCCRNIFASLFIVFVLGNLYFLYPFVSDKHEHSKNVKNEKKIEEISDKIIESFKNKDENIETKEENFETKDEVVVPKSVVPTAIPSVKIVKEEKKFEKTELIQKLVMAVLVISCDRPTVRRCLDGLFSYKPKDVDIPVIVSQDCGHEPTAEVIQSFGSKIIHIKQPDLGNVHNIPGGMERYMGYYKISRHYKWALGKVFSRQNIDSVVIVEDDLDIAPDFFDYFLATRPLLDEDHSLFCVSAWNDNGKSGLIDEKAIDLLYRTDFFSGLGWLLTRKIWLELADKWPLGFWDDWIRQPEQRQGRACIRPEIPRTRTFGRIGVSLGQFFDEHLQFIKLNGNPYPFLEYDLNHLLQKNYDKKFLDEVYNSNELRDSMDVNEPIRVTYNSKYEFENIARRYGMMSDLKSGVARTAYRGIITIYRDSRRIYIAPNKDWKKYEE